MNCNLITKIHWKWKKIIYFNYRYSVVIICLLFHLQSFVTFFIVSLCFILGDAALPNQETVVPAVLGSSVTLECNIIQTQILIWDHTVSHNQSIIAHRGNIVIPNSLNQTKFFVQVRGNKQSLIIRSLTLQDDGVYKCWEVQNSVKKQSFKVNILGK